MPRYNIEFTDKQNERIEEMRKMWGLDSRADVIRKALALTNALLEIAGPDVKALTDPEETEESGKRTAIFWHNIRAALTGYK